MLLKRTGLHCSPEYMTIANPIRSFFISGSKLLAISKEGSSCFRFMYSSNILETSVVSSSPDNYFLEKWAFLPDIKLCALDNSLWLVWRNWTCPPRSFAVGRLGKGLYVLETFQVTILVGVELVGADFNLIFKRLISVLTKWEPVEKNDHREIEPWRFVCHVL